MNRGTEVLCLRLLDLARKQKAAIEAGNLDEVLTLAGTRQQVLREIQKIDGSPGGAGADGKPTAPAAVLRQVLAIDEEVAGVVRADLEDTSLKLSKINTFKTFCQGVVDEARLRRAVPNP
jgi:hypothetical protein